MQGIKFIIADLFANVLRALHASNKQVAQNYMYIHYRAYIIIM